MFSEGPGGQNMPKTLGLDKEVGLSSEAEGSISGLSVDGHSDGREYGEMR